MQHGWKVLKGFPTDQKFEDMSFTGIWQYQMAGAKLKWTTKA